MYVYLIRHGATQWNKENRIQGREDIPLSSEGMAQVQVCARAFRGMELQLIASSPLSRALDTARAIAAVTGAPVVERQGLIERDFGDISGKVVDIINPEKYTTDLEPLDQVADRVEAALQELAGECTGSFAAVSHGGSINALLKKLTNGEIGSGKTRLKNACISVLQWDGDTFTVRDFNLEAGEFLEKYRA